MKLIKRADDYWQYLLNQVEVDILAGLLKRFPLSRPAPARCAITATDAKALEREILLNEALAEHRKELEKLAATVLSDDKWQKFGKDHLLTLDPSAREILLQILNDIRVGNWRALGEPESLDSPITAQNLTRRQLIDLAGYFEMGLIESEEQ